MVTAGSLAAVEPPPDLRSAEWKPLLEKRQIDPAKDDIAVLIFDHSSQLWSVYHYSHLPTGAMAAQPEPLGADGNPQVLRSGSEKVLILITNTNPFLYSYEGNVLPPQESADAAALKSLAGALGTAAAGLGHAAVPIGFDQADADKLKKATADLEKLSRNLATADGIRQRIREFVQAFEFGSPTTLAGLAPDEINTNIKEVLAGFKNARTDREALDHQLKPAGQLPACFAPWAGLLALLDSGNITDDDLKAVRADVAKSAGAALTDCRETLNLERRDIDSLLKVTGPDREKRAEALNADPTTATRRAILAFDQAVAGEKDVVAALGAARSFIRIAEDYLGRNGNDYVVLGRTGTATIAPPFPAQSWLKDNPGTLSIKAEASVCSDCVRLRPLTTADKKFILTSRRQGFLGLGFGVIYTTIKDPAFGAVHLNKDTSVIARTGEDSRSGLLVIIGSVRLRHAINKNASGWPVELCADLGAGVDPKKPSVLLGASFEFFRYARLGFGETWQVITRLADGLQEAKYGPDGLPIAGTGTVVFASGDVRTRNRVTAKPYASLSFALDALPFFQSK